MSLATAAEYALMLAAEPTGPTGGERCRGGRPPGERTPRPGLGS